MACDSPPGIHATAKGRSLLAGNVRLPEAGMPDDLGRDGIGAVVRIDSASGKQWNMVRSGSSYCSHVIGLG